MKIFLIVLVIIIVIGGGIFLYFRSASSRDVPSSTSGTTQMANPASVYCVDQGGKLEIKESPTGQYGVCVFSDGRECEEWQFYNTKVCE